MSRSVWKGPHLNTKDIQIKTLKKNQYQNIFKVSRNSTITPKFLGLSVQIHNGKSFNEVIITDLMIGHKFGEFSFTRAKFAFKKKKSNKKKIQIKKKNSNKKRKSKK